MHAARALALYADASVVDAVTGIVRRSELWSMDMLGLLIGLLVLVLLCGGMYFLVRFAAGFAYFLARFAAGCVYCLVRFAVRCAYWLMRLAAWYATLNGLLICIDRCFKWIGYEKVHWLLFRVSQPPY